MLLARFISGAAEEEEAEAAAFTSSVFFSAPAAVVAVAGVTGTTAFVFASKADRDEVRTI